MSVEIDVTLARSLLPPRPEAAHKGVFGHLFILAGSRGFTGAAKLACEGALRSGVGLVTVGVPRPLGDLVGAMLTEGMSHLLPATDAETFSREAVDPALRFAADKQAVVLGPGLSRHVEAHAFAIEFLLGCPVPTLVDADGLNALSAAPDALLRSPGPRVITPHPLELARLVGAATAQVQADRESAARDAARRFGCVVALKGHRTIVADASGETFVNPTGNAGLAKGGSGDVLSGLIGGLLAQGMPALQAALLGVYVHGLAGDIAAAAKTQRGMVITDVIHALPEAWRRVEQDA